MIRLSNLTLFLNHTEEALKTEVAKRLEVPEEAVGQIVMFKRSYDARSRRKIKLVYILDVTLNEGASFETEEQVLERHAENQNIRLTPDIQYRLPEVSAGGADQKRPVVVGLGPCGFFAALILAELGLKPLVLERGKSVRKRTADTFSFWRKGTLDPESNVQFGEGGAGTFSDGKLYSQIKDSRNLSRKVLHEFVEAGAPPEILFESRPHIGTFKLVKMVESMRAKIESMGGEIRFESRVEDFRIEDGAIRGLTLSDGEEIETDHVVLALGHSARDTFEVLHSRGVFMEPKPFSIGVRAEHPQALIDKARYGKNSGHPILGAADYRLVHHCESGRSVYSFCMCPGGTVVASSSEEGGVVTNGMSQYDRSERNANSGIVVGIEPEKDFPGGPLAGLHLQRKLEQLAFEAGGGNYEAPAQKMGDFLEKTPSLELGSVKPSYTPGVHLTELEACLPAFVLEAIREAIPHFAKKVPGYDHPDALMTGVETRTSSPLRMTRGDNFQSLTVQGLFPAGEGAGYAGGILSAAVDGIQVAEALAQAMSPAS